MQGPAVNEMLDSSMLTQKPPPCLQSVAARLTPVRNLHFSLQTTLLAAAL